MQVAQASAPVPLTVKSELSRLYLGLNYSDTPGIQSISPNELHSKLQSLIPLILELKSQLETTLVQGEVGDAQLIKNLEFYITIVKQVILTHASANSLETIDQRILSLSIPYGVTRKLLGLNHINIDKEVIKKAMEMFTSYNSIFSFSPESLQNSQLKDSDLLSLVFRPETLRGYKVQFNATKEMKEKIYLKLAKYIAVNTLYTQLVKLNTLAPSLDVPPLPRLLQKELAELSDVQVQVDKQTHAIRNEAMDWAIEELLSKNKITVFNQTFWQKYESIAGVCFRDRLKEKISESEHDQTLMTFREQLRSFPLPISDLNADTRVKSLRQLMITAKTVSFSQLLPTAEEVDDSPKKEKNISLLSEKLTKLVEESLSATPDSLFSNWLADAEKLAKSTFADHKIKELTKDLYQQSLDIMKVNVLANYGYLNEMPINHQLARMAFQKEINDLHMRTSAQNLWNFVLSSESYKDSATQYKSLLSKYADQLKTSPPDQIKVLNDDISSLNKAGGLFGFNLETKGNEGPTLSHLIEKGAVSKAQAESYLRAFQNKSLNNPLLTLTDERTGKPLHEALSLVPPSKFSIAEGKVKTALRSLWGNIIKALDKIARTDSTSELTVFFAQSSFLHQQFQKSMPTLANYEQTLTKALLDSMETRTKYETYSSIVSQPMTWFLPLFMFPMLMLPLQSTLLTPVHPFIMGINRLHSALSPHVSGYMLAAMGLIISDVGFQIKDRMDASQDLKDMTELYQTSLDSEHAFFDYTEVSDAENKLHVSNLSLASSIGMQVFFLGSFFLTTAIRESGVLLMDGWRERQFHKVGFENNTYKWNADSIQAKAKESKSKLDEDSSIQDVFRKSRIQEVDRAEKSLLALLKRQESRRDQIINQFALQRANLGISDVKNPFNYELLSDSIRNIRNQYATHQISEKQLFLAEEAFSEIVGFMQTELSFSQPGPMRRLFYYSKKKIYPRLSEPSDSIIRQNLFQQVYGFNAVKKDHYRTLNIDKDHYLTLGLNEQAKSEEIKRAYRQLARKYHPDLNPNLSKADQSKIIEINEAYEILSDPIKRNDYDSLRRKGGSNGQ
jgi:DnaJ-domain-containing protein 1